MRNYFILAAAFLLIIVGIFNEFLLDSNLLMLNMDQLNSLGSRYLRVHDFFMTLWDDSRLGGVPTLDAMFGDAYHPLVLTQWIFDPARAIGFKFILSVFVAFLTSTYLFQKLSGSWEWAGLLGFLYALNPQFFSHIYGGHDGKMMVFSMAPFAIAGIYNIVKEGRWLGMFQLTFSVVWMILSSHLQLTYFFLWGAGFYTLFLAFTETSSPLFKVRRVSIAALGLALALGLTAFQILAPMEYTSSQSIRGTGEKTSMGHAVSWSLHPEEMASMLVPGFLATDVHKNPDANTDGYWGHNQFKLNHDTAGSLLTLLAFLSLFIKGNRRLAIFFLAGSSIALSYALGANSPLFQLWYEILPGVKNFRAPSMAIFWIPLAMGIMAASLFESIRNVEMRKNLLQPLFLYLGFALIVVIARQQWTSVIGIPAALLVIVLGLISAGMLSQQDRNEPMHIVGAINSIFRFFPGMSRWELGALLFPFIVVASTLFQPDALFSNSDIAQYFKPINEIVMNRSGNAAFGSFAFIAFFSGALWFATKLPKWQMATLLAIVAGIELFSINNDYVQNIPRDRQLKANHPIIQGILADSKDSLQRSRVLSFSKDPAISGNVFASYNLRGSSGFHDNELATSRKFREELFQIKTLDELKNNPYIALYDIGYFVWDTQEGTQVIRTNGNMGPATFYSQYAIAENNKAIETLSQFPHYRTVALVEKKLAKVNPQQQWLTSSIPDTNLPQGQVKLLQSPRMDHQIYQVNSPSNGLVVIAGNYHPYWKATIDGQSSKVLRAFGTLRAVEVSAGEHTIEMRYVSDSIQKSLRIMILSAGILTLLALVTLIWGRKLYF